MIHKFQLGCLMLFVCFSTMTAQTVNISGTVTLHNGEPLAGVMVTCTNADPVFSDENGLFVFSNLPEGEDYLINGAHETNIYEGVTVLDLLFTANFILGLNELSAPAQIVAGDYNFSGTISTFDLVLTRKTLIRQALTLNGPDWVFFNNNTSIPNSGIFLNDLTEDAEDLHLVGVKRGNIALEADHLPAPVNAPEPVYYFENQSVAAGALFEVSVLVDDFQSIAGFQHGLHWDNSLLDFVALEFATDIGGDFNHELEEEGELILFASHYLITFEDYLYLEDGSLIYTLTFQANEPIDDLAAVLQFSDALIPFQTVFATSTDQLYLLSEDYQAGVVTSNQEIASLSEFKINPTLTEDRVEIGIRFNAPKSGTLQLLDMEGRLLKSWKVEGIDFLKTISLATLPCGTYAVLLRTKEGVQTKRIIKH